MTKSSLLLLEVCRTADLLDALKLKSMPMGTVLPWGVGVRAHPAAVELRQHPIALARLLATLRVPGDEPQERQARGARGVYDMQWRRVHG